MTRDLRRYARQTNVRLLAGFFIILLIVGEGLIYVIYGPQPALVGLLCLFLGLMPLLLIFAALLIIEWVVKRADK